MATKTLSEFQKKKIIHVFTLLYDRNGDGDITRKDFELSIEEICELLNWTEGSDKHKEAQSTLTGIWEGLKKYADENEDDIVSKNEWLNMWKDCITKSNDVDDFPPWQKNFIDFMFKVNDTSGDGEIDINEYTTVYTKYKVSKEDCVEAFTKIAGDVKNTINKKAFEELWFNYFVKDDITSNANYLFGVPEFMRNLKPE